MSTTVPPDGQFDPVSGRIPSIMPTEAVATSSIDVAANKGVVLFELDMAQIALSSVSVKTTNTEKLKILTLEAIQNGGVNQRTPTRLKNIGGLDILIEAKSAEEIANYFRAVIRSCEK